MAVLSTIKKNYYQDSMKLMQLSQRLSNVKGVNIVKNRKSIVNPELLNR